ncbi:hypothetical protein MMC17_003235 [Xylographa soralifera]|nr:hypothetical protein [Xylographa soralifera]
MRPYSQMAGFGFRMPCDGNENVTKQFSIDDYEPLLVCDNTQGVKDLPVGPNWMRQPTQARDQHIYSAVYSKKAQYQSLFQYEVEQKLSLMWEKDAEKMENTDMLDLAIPRRGTVTAMVPYGRRLVYTIELYPGADTNPNIDLGSEDQLVVYWSDEDDDKPNTARLSTNKVPGRLCFDVNTNRRFQLQEIVKCWVGIKTNHVPLDRQFAAIGNAVTARAAVHNIFDLRSSILGAGYTGNVDIQRYIDPAAWIKVKGLVEKAFPLNPSQQDPFNRIFDTGVANGLMLIQGPPGTGKTLVSSAITLACSASDLKVLVGAGSNPGVDALFRYIIGKGRGDTASMKHLQRLTGLMIRATNRTKFISDILYGNIEKRIATWAKRAVPTSLPVDDGSDDYDDNDDINWHLMSWEVIRHCRKLNNQQGWKDVYAEITTARAVPRGHMPSNIGPLTEALNWAKMQVLRDPEVRVVASTVNNVADCAAFQYDVFINDECGQTSEPQTMIPLSTGLPKFVVLVGDQKQLPPTVKSEHRRNNPYASQHSCSFFELYNRRVFVHVASQPTKAEGTSSWENAENAKVIKRIVDSMLTFTSSDGTTLTARDIFVLTACKAQKDRLHETLAKNKPYDGFVRASTINASQGHEKTVVVLDPTAAPVSHDDYVGFVGDEQRFNDIKQRKAWVTRKPAVAHQSIGHNASSDTRIDSVSQALLRARLNVQQLGMPSKRAHEDEDGPAPKKVKESTETVETTATTGDMEGVVSTNMQTLPLATLPLATPSDPPATSSNEKEDSTWTETLASRPKTGSGEEATSTVNPVEALTNVADDDADFGVDNLFGDDEDFTMDAETENGPRAKGLFINMDESEPSFNHLEVVAPEVIAGPSTQATDVVSNDQMEIDSGIATEANDTAVASTETTPPIARCGPPFRAGADSPPKPYGSIPTPPGID